MAFTPETGDVWLKRDLKSLQFQLDGNTYDLAPSSAWFIAGENVVAGRALSIATLEWQTGEPAITPGRAYYTDTLYVEKCVGISLNAANAGDPVQVRSSGLYEWDTANPPFLDNAGAPYVPVSDDLGKIVYIAQEPAGTDGMFTLDRTSAALGGSAIIEVGVLSSIYDVGAGTITAVAVALEGDGKGLNTSQVQYVAGEIIDLTLLPVPTLVCQDPSDGFIYRADRRKSVGRENAIGFIVPGVGVTSIGIGDTVLVQTAGVIEGFAGLTPGQAVLADIDGAVTQSTTSFNYYTDKWFNIGIANTASSILLRLEACAEMTDINHIGAFIAMGTAVADSDYLACTGQTLDSVANPQYADLYSAIGTTYGGTGPDDFDLPDLSAYGPHGLEIRYQYVYSFPTYRSDAPAYRWSSTPEAYPADPSDYEIDIDTSSFGSDVPLEDVVVTIYASTNVPSAISRKFEATIHDLYYSSAHYNYGFQVSKTAANHITCTLGHDGLAYADPLAASGYTPLDANWTIYAVAMKSEKWNRFYDYTGDQKLNAVYALNIRDLTMSEGPGVGPPVVDITTQRDGEMDRGVVDPTHTTRLNYDGAFYAYSLNLTESLTVGSNTDLGTSSANTLTINSTIDSDLLFDDNNRIISMTASSGVNQAGSNLDICSGQSTGTGTSDITFRTPSPGMAGADVNALVDRLKIDNVGLNIEEGLVRFDTSSPTIDCLDRGVAETGVAGRDIHIVAGNTSTGNAISMDGGFVYLDAGKSWGNGGASRILLTSISSDGPAYNETRVTRVKVDEDGLGLVSGNTRYFAILRSTESLSADRFLTLNINNADRILTLNYDFTVSGAAKTISGTGNTIALGYDLTVSGAAKTLTGSGTQISIGGNLTTANALTLSGNYAVTLTAINTTTLTMPTTGTLATLAGSESLTNKTINGLTITSVSSKTLNLSAASLTVGTVTTNAGTVTIQSAGNSATSIVGPNGGTATLQAGTMALTNTSLSQFGSTTSAELRTLMSDETGTGVLVFGTSPTITDSLTISSSSTTTNVLPITANSLTTGNAISITANALTSGAAISISSSSTARTTDNALVEISSSGTNASSSIVARGLSVSVTNGGTTNTNVGAYITVSGGTLNYSAHLLGEDGVIITTATTSNDGIILKPREGGSSSYRVTVTPTTLSGNRTLTLANEDTTLTAGTMVSSVSGLTPTSVGAITLANLTKGDGLSYSSGTTYNGGSAVTISLTAITAGENTVGALAYNGTAKAAGKLYGGTTDPTTDGSRLNYDGNLHTTNLYVSKYLGSVSSSARMPFIFTSTSAPDNTTDGVNGDVWIVY